MELNYSLSSHSSSLEGKKKPPKKVGQATVGNSHIFAQQKKQALDNNRSSSAAASLFEQSDYNILGLIKLDIGHLSNCCSKGKKLSGGGCLLSCFGYYQNKSPATTSTAAAASTSSAAACDQSNSNQQEEEQERAIAAAAEYIKTCRQLGVTDTNRTKEARDGFVQEIYRGCIISDELNEDGSTRKYQMQYEIPSIDNRLGRKNRLQVCLPTMLCVYGITKYEWRICGDHIKSSDFGRVSSMRQRFWKDDHLHDYTYAEVQSIFEKNLKDTIIPGRRYIIIVL